MLLLTSSCYYCFILCARQFFFGLRCGSRRTHIAPSHRTKRSPSASGSTCTIQNHRVAQRRVMRACHGSLKSSANQCAGRSRLYQLLQVLNFSCGYCWLNSGYTRSESLVVTHDSHLTTHKLLSDRIFSLKSSANQCAGRSRLSFYNLLISLVVTVG